MVNDIILEMKKFFADLGEIWIKGKKSLIDILLKTGEVLSGEFKRKIY